MILTIIKQYKLPFSLRHMRLKCLSVIHSWFQTSRCLMTKKNKAKEKILKSFLTHLIGWIVEASQSAKYYKPFPFFFSISFRFSKTHLQPFFNNLWPYYRVNFTYFVIIVSAPSSRMSRNMCKLCLKIKTGLPQSL